MSVVSTYLLLIILQVFDSSVGQLRKNSCKRFRDYVLSDFNDNCWYDPDLDLDTPDLMKKYTGRSESYEVTTEDGYILSVFRMPRDNPKGVVLLMHPMLLDSRCYMSQGNKSTGYLLWQDGYDIWLGNQRGTHYSEKHVSLTSSDPRFWDFGLMETGCFDTHAMLDLVTKKTGQKVIYIGHSMGTTNGLIYASMRPDEAKARVERFVFVSVSAYYKYGKSPLLIFGNFEPFFRQLNNILDLGSLLPILPTLIQIGKVYFRINPLAPFFSSLGASFWLGGDASESDPSAINLDSLTGISNVSMKLLFHILQLIKSKDRFQAFDYGSEENLKLYGKQVAPQFPIKKIKVPIHLIASSSDELTTLKDAELLYERLPPAAKSENGFGLKLSVLNHIDIQTGKHRAEIFVNNLIKLLDQIRHYNKSS